MDRYRCCLDLIRFSVNNKIAAILNYVCPVGVSSQISGNFFFLDGDADAYIVTKVDLCYMSIRLNYILYEGVVVQWLDYLAVTQEPGVILRFSTSEKVASDVAPPSGHKLHLTSGTADRAMWSDCNSHTVVAHDQSCVEVLGKPLISRRLCPPSSDGYLVERES